MAWVEVRSSNFQSLRLDSLSSRTSICLQLTLFHLQRKEFLDKSVLMLVKQALVSRLVAEERSGAAMLDEDLKSSLGLSNASGRQYRASTAQSSFMRPLCRTVKVRQGMQLTPMANITSSRHQTLLSEIAQQIMLCYL